MATGAPRQGFLARLLPASGSEQFFDLLEQHADRTREAAALLAEMLEKQVDPAQQAERVKAVEHQGDEINRLENEGDQLLRRAVARLFHDSTDPIHVIKWKEIYDNLENAIDRCEDVANVIEGVALEYA